MFPLQAVEALFGDIPNVAFAAKDSQLRFVAANPEMLDLTGVTSRGDIIGRSSGDFFARETCRRYEEHDRFVMRTGRPMRDSLDFTARLRGGPLWVLISRWPILARGQIEGVAIIARRLRRVGAMSRAYGAPIERREIGAASPSGSV